MKEKSIIISIPHHFGLPERFKNNLEKIGFRVFLIPNHEKKTKIPISISDTIIHFFKKTFLKDRTHKAAVKTKFIRKKELHYLDSINYPVDYALVIRPDLLSLETIRSIKAKTKVCVAYQWDGLDRYPMVKKTITEFDKFFVFDVRDLEVYPQCQPLTNFYFNDLVSDIPIIHDVFFVGTFMKDRMELLCKIADRLEQEKMRVDLNIYYCRVGKNIKQYQRSNINFTTKPLRFEENLKRVLQAKVLLDFTNKIHYGLSFRTFESIGYSKKLITNNPLVKTYDFYNPNNMFVIENDNLEGLEDFMKSPYEELDPQIKEKYSFSTWIKTVFL